VIHSDYTLMTVARDPQNQRYYYKTYDDQTIRMVDLKAFDLAAKTIRQVSTKSEQPVVDMSTKLKPASEAATSGSSRWWSDPGAGAARAGPRVRRACS
jgi:hypothetical protein